MTVRFWQKSTRPSLTRGLAYHRQGRVRDINVEPDGMGLLAAVQGSDLEPYEVDITVTRSRRHGYVVEGFCTCPVGYNCKHVAAALYAVLSPGQQHRQPHSHPT